MEISRALPPALSTTTTSQGLHQKGVGSRAEARSLLAGKKDAEEKKSRGRTQRTPCNNRYSSLPSVTLKPAMCHDGKRVLQRSLHPWHCSNQPGVIFKPRGGCRGEERQQNRGISQSKRRRERGGTGMKTKPGLGGVTAAPWHRASTGTKRASGRTAARSRGSARAAGGEKKPAESPCKRKAFPPHPCKAASPCCSARGRGGLPDSLPVLSAARPLPREDLGTGWGHQSGHSTKRQLVLNTKSTGGDAKTFSCEEQTAGVSHY